jgi:hypothetical protein
MLISHDFRLFFRLATLVQKFGMNFEVSADIEKRLRTMGIYLLTISYSKRL